MFLQVDGDYLSKQTDITEKMRSILVDWIIQVHQKFKLLHETLYLSILILDRYLSQTDIKRGECSVNTERTLKSEHSSLFSLCMIMLVVSF